MRQKVFCGARTRRGTSCQCKALANGRCKFHGGMSTGPITFEGQVRSLSKLRQFQGLGEKELRARVRERIRERELERLAEKKELLVQEMLEAQRRRLLDGDAA